jgi:hypothetical protein
LSWKCRCGCRPTFRHHKQQTNTLLHLPLFVFYDIYIQITLNFFATVHRYRWRIIWLWKCTYHWFVRRVQNMPKWTTFWLLLTLDLIEIQWLCKSMFAQIDLETPQNYINLINTRLQLSYLGLLLTFNIQAFHTNFTVHTVSVTIVWAYDWSVTLTASEKVWRTSRINTKCIILKVHFG